MRKESVPMVFTGHMKRAFILSFETKSCSISQMKRHPVSKERLLQSNMSGKGQSIYWKVLTINTRCPDPQHHLEPLQSHLLYFRAPDQGGYGQHMHIWMLRKEWLDYVENKKFRLLISSIFVWACIFGLHISILPWTIIWKFTGIISSIPMVRNPT